MKVLVVVLTVVALVFFTSDSMADELKISDCHSLYSFKKKDVKRLWSGHYLLLGKRLHEWSEQDFNAVKLVNDKCLKEKETMGWNERDLNHYKKDTYESVNFVLTKAPDWLKENLEKEKAEKEALDFIRSAKKELRSLPSTPDSLPRIAQIETQLKEKRESLPKAYADWDSVEDAIEFKKKVIKEAQDYKEASNFAKGAEEELRSLPNKPDSLLQITQIERQLKKKRESIPTFSFWSSVEDAIEDKRRAIKRVQAEEDVLKLARQFEQRILSLPDEEKSLEKLSGIRSALKSSESFRYGFGGLRMQLLNLIEEKEATIKEARLFANCDEKLKKVGLPKDMQDKAIWAIHAGAVQFQATFKQLFCSIIELGNKIKFSGQSFFSSNISFRSIRQGQDGYIEYSLSKLEENGKIAYIVDSIYLSSSMKSSYLTSSERIRFLGMLGQ